MRCLARSAPKLAAREWADDPRVEIVEADLADTEALEVSMRGCQAAYYLVHSMVVTGASYADADRRLAEGFVWVAGRAGVGRIILDPSLASVLTDGRSAPGRQLSRRSRPAPPAFADGPESLRPAGERSPRT